MIKRPSTATIKEPLQVGRQVARGLVTPVRLFRQALERDRFQVFGDVPVQFAGTGRLVVQDLQREHPLRAAERQFARQELEENHAQAVNVAAGVDAMSFAAGLLGRHVRRRAEDLSFERHRQFARVALGQAEVGDVRRSVLVDQDVRRLEVAMDHAMLVRVLQRQRDFDHHLGGFAEGDRLHVEPFPQRGAVDELAHDVDLARFAADFVHGDNSRMPQLGCGPRFAEEPLGVDLIKLCAVRELDRHHAIQFLIARLPHAPEGPPPQLL
jgi:hypothetical protein